MIESLINVQYFKESIFVLLSLGVVTINKYVLSVLHFTIPTVFQAWQTLVCAVLLTLLIKFSHFRIDVQTVDWKKWPHLILPLLCFSLSNVTGSKALAELPVGVFLAGTNVITAIRILLCRNKSSAGSLALCGSTALLYLMYSGHDTGWLWLAVHVVSQLIQVVTLSALHFPSVTAIYYCNFSSIIILLPLSIYLQEASSALNHARHANTEFFLGCLLSGVLGTGLQLLSGNLPDRSSATLYQGVSKILACTLSIIFFPNDLDPLCWFLIVLNLVISCFMHVGEDTKMDLMGLTPKSLEVTLV